MRQIKFKQQKYSSKQFIERFLEKMRKYRDCKRCIWFEDCQKQKLCHQPCSYYDPNNDSIIEYQWNEMDYNIAKGEDITDTEEMIEWFKRSTDEEEI